MDAAVEAAAQALWAMRTSEPWNERLAEFPDSVDVARTRADARAILSTARPFIWFGQAAEVAAAVRADERAKVLAEVGAAWRRHISSGKHRNWFLEDIRALGEVSG
jgi:hypothetical protein